MLNRHPAIAIYRESDFHHYVYRRRRSFGSLGDLPNRQRLVKEYLSTGCVKRMQMDLQALEARLLEEGVGYQAFFLSLLRYFAHTQGKRRCGEKTPRHALITEALCEWYPGASIIHMVRRSEERRVGKECSSCGGPRMCKKVTKQIRNA